MVMFRTTSLLIAVIGLAPLTCAAAQSASAQSASGQSPSEQSQSGQSQSGQSQSGQSQSGQSQSGQSQSGQTPGDEQPAPAKPEERSTGLPSKIHWTFNFDATWGTFGFANSLFQNPKEDVPENLSDQWFEGSLKPALSASYQFANTTELFGKASGVGERTYGSAPELVGPDISSFQVDDLFVGWRSGDRYANLGKNAFELTVGRARYQLGQGLLLWDGAAEGGSRGGYWTNARKAFQFAAIGRFHPHAHSVEAFYLDKDDLPENDTGTRLWGTNYEFTPSKRATFGVTYLKFFAHADILPKRDGLNVFNVRSYVSPFPSAPDAEIDFEYASERNGEELSSNAWTVQGAYELSQVTWKPKFTYRFAYFQGDDPNTPKNEGFDPLLPGFHDWGTWWQGEIAGEYFVSNSNLTSHLIRAHVTPHEKVGGGVMLFKFRLDQPESYAAGVTDKNLVFETDTYVDWKINKTFTASFVVAVANPQKAAQQAFDRTKNFTYGMVFLAYSY